MIYAIIVLSHQADILQILPGELHGARLAFFSCCHGNVPMVLPISQRDEVRRRRGAGGWLGGGINVATIFGFNF